MLTEQPTKVEGPASDRDSYVSIFLVATFSSLYGDGKNILGEVPGLSLLVLFLFFLELLVRSNYASTKYALLSGIFLGFALAAKPTFLPVVPALLLASLLNYRTIVWKKEWLIAGTCGAIVCVGAWVFTQFSSADSFSQVLHFYSNPYSLANISEVMKTNFLRFFKESTPLYTLLTFLVWAAAILWRSLKKTEPISISEMCAFFFTILILLAYLRTPGWYRYLFLANILTLLFFPSALRSLLSGVASRFRGHLTGAAVVSYVTGVFLILLLAFQTYHMVFDSWVSGTAGSNKTAALSAYFDALPQGKSVFVYDVPEVVPFLKTADYYQYFSAGGVWVAGAQYLPDITKGVPDIIVVGDDSLPQVLSLGGGYMQKGDIAGKYAILEKK